MLVSASRDRFVTIGPLRQRKTAPRKGSSTEGFETPKKRAPPRPRRRGRLLAPIRTDGHAVRGFGSPGCRTGDHGATPALPPSAVRALTTRLGPGNHRRPSDPNRAVACGGIQLGCLHCIGRPDDPRPPRSLGVLSRRRSRMLCLMARQAATPPPRWSRRAAAPPSPLWRYPDGVPNDSCGLASGAISRPDPNRAMTASAH